MSIEEQNGGGVSVPLHNGSLSPSRVVGHFSCGAASAVAMKLALAEYGPEIVICNAFVAEEHEDNRRFLGDCEVWFGGEVIVLRDQKYGASTHEVWRRKRYIKGIYGAPCSKALKREVLEPLMLPNDIHVLGYTAEEQDRFDRFLDANNGIHARAILIEKSLTKADCLAIVDRAGIELPYMYRIGFDNANCKGCPKGGQNYWCKVRKYFPSDFSEIVKIQNEIGPGAYFLQHRSGPKKGQRMSLLELPDGDGDMADEPSFSCSFFCEMAEQDMEACE